MDNPKITCKSSTHEQLDRNLKLLNELDDLNAHLYTAMGRLDGIWKKGYITVEADDLRVKVKSELSEDGELYMIANWIDEIWCSNDILNVRFTYDGGKYILEGKGNIHLIPYVRAKE